MWGRALKGADGTITGLAGAAQDISDVRRAERELAARARDLERSNADLEHFAYAASHDLQEPLRMVASYVQLLARRYRGKLDRDADEFIAFAVDGAERMQKLIRDLLTYSRVTRLSRPGEPVDLGHTLRAAMANLKVAIEDSGACVGQIKLELFQHTGSFKARGAFSTVIGRDIPEAGIAAASGGNHGAAAAYAAYIAGVPAHIFVPAIASPAKVAKIKSYGAIIDQDGATYYDALAKCERRFSTRTFAERKATICSKHHGQM